MLRSDAIKIFLTKSTWSDLSYLYSSGMEVQVNVAQDEGERISTEGYQGRTWHSYSDGVQEWYSIRMPKKAFSVPENNDFEIKYDISVHAEGIGLTGWNFKSKTSKWVAFDFDAIAGHTSNILSDTELKAVRDTAYNIPWVTVRKSTSGSGLHLYVFLSDVPTENHNEHAALARSILGKMSALTGFDFASRVDCCGGVMWVWHRKKTDDNEGLKLIKRGNTLTDIPINWKDHISVICGKKRKTRPGFIENKEEDIFDQLTGQRSRVRLSEQHRKLLDFLSDTKSSWWWDQDHQMLVCHTFDLKRAHDALKLRGLFNTVATGKEQGSDHNCFCFALDRPDGAWVVRRYSPGIQESLSWKQDASGWTYCYFNRDPSLDIAASAYGGMEDEKGGFVFNDGKSAVDAAKMLGAQTNSPDWMSSRPALLKQHKDGRLIIHIKREPTDKYDEVPGWREDKGHWKRLFDVKLQQPGESKAMDFDDLIRHVITETGDDYGWVIKTGDNWHNEPMTHVRVALKALYFSESEISKILGHCVLEGWTLTNEPFQDEYIGGRKWNRNAAEFRYLPKDDEPFIFPTWQKILDHCGKGLDSTIKKNGWCKANSIKTGADYLKIWVASLFRFPKEHLPYLFFFSKEERTGKTTFHEAIGSLMTRGYVRADTYLISSAGFNGELENAILCVVEETNLQKNPGARNRIKDWITASNISIHHKGRTPYQVENTVHFVQTGNESTECPIFPGDTRITMIHVPPFDLVDMIPTTKMKILLEKEAPDFMASLLRVEIPPSNDRLFVPTLDTEIKKQTQKHNRTQLEEFLDETTYYVPGTMILYSELYNQFLNWLDPNEVYTWTKIKFGKKLPPHFPKGRVMSEGAQYYVGNISLTSIETEDSPLILCDNKLEVEI